MVFRARVLKTNVSTTRIENRLVRAWILWAPWAAVIVAVMSFGSLIQYSVSAIWIPIVGPVFETPVVALWYLLLCAAIFLDRPMRRARQALFLASAVACSAVVHLIAAFVLKKSGACVDFIAPVMLLALSMALLLKRHGFSGLAQAVVVITAGVPLFVVSGYLSGMRFAADYPFISVLAGLFCIVAFAGRTAHRAPLRYFLAEKSLDGKMLRRSVVLFLPLSFVFLAFSWRPLTDGNFLDADVAAIKAAAFVLVLVLIIGYMNNGFAGRRRQIGEEAGPSWMASDLPGAWERGELFLLYQPQISVVTKQITGVEVLVRWRHPKHGVISPTEFIPLAEQSGEIALLGRWVLREACRHAVTWCSTSLAGIKVAVNVSAVQLDHPGFAAMVESILCETQLPPYRLVLEVTESSMMRKGDRALKVLGELRATGVKIAIDDFGTGYSSLSYLQILPSDYLKIDKSFIRVLPDNLRSAAIARSIIALGHTLGLRTLAEGVETKEQEAFLEAIWCDEVQGYLYAKPLSEEALARWAGDRAVSSELPDMHTKEMIQS